MMRILSAAAAFLILAAPVRGQTVAPGTYRFDICEPNCGRGSTRSIATGMLVLFADSTALGLATREHGITLNTQALFFTEGRLAGNACFKVTQRLSSVNDREFYLGITPNGITRWTSEGDSVLVPLYRSPDASYVLTWSAAQPTTGRIVGVGIQNDCCMKPRGPFGMLVAVRIGEPDVRSCV